MTEPTFLCKKKQKIKKNLEMVCDQTNVRLNPPLMRPFPS